MSPCPSQRMHCVTVLALAYPLLVRFFFFFLLTPSCSPVTTLSLPSLPMDARPSSPPGPTTVHPPTAMTTTDNITRRDNSDHDRDTARGMATTTTQPCSPMTAPASPRAARRQRLRHHARRDDSACDTTHGATTAPATPRGATKAPATPRAARRPGRLSIRELVVLTTNSVLFFSCYILLV
jgi:hypothetical protein